MAIVIEKQVQFELCSGDLTVKLIPGDAHLTTSSIYHNQKLIKNGEGTVEVTTKAKPIDVILIVATIFKPEGTSEFASLSVELEDDCNAKRWDYSSHEPDSVKVVYKVTIKFL